MTASAKSLFKATRAKPDRGEALPIEKKAKRNRGSGKGLKFCQAALLSNTDQCIEWPFYRMKNGYAQVGLHSGMMLAHRWVCLNAHGEPPFDRAQAAHECGNRSCVNPCHIRWATQAENEDDKRKHGTWHSRISSRTVTDDDVRAIRLLIQWGHSTRRICFWFDVPKWTVQNIRAGKTWRHIK